MKLPRPLAAIAMIACAISAGPAVACSVGPGYRAQTNFELARDADAIVIGKVIAGKLDKDDPEESAITVRPVRLLKGEMPLTEFTLGGMTLSRDVGRGSEALSNPYEFEAAHPVSYWGACIRYVFPQGTTVLFFLDRGPGGRWQPAGSAFSRWAEDVPGEEAPWVKLTELYLGVAGLPPAERDYALANDRDRLRSAANDPLAELMEADIDRSLRASADGGNGLFTEEARTESMVNSTLEKMRNAAIEGGN